MQLNTAESSTAGGIVREALAVKQRMQRDALTHVKRAIYSFRGTGAETEDATSELDVD